MWPETADTHVAGEPLRAALMRRSLHLTVLTSLSLLIGGLEIGTVNHTIQVPVVWRTLDPSLYTATSFGEYLSRYYSLYWTLVARGVEHLGLQASLLVAHAMTRAVLLSGLYAFAFALFRSRRVALVAALLPLFDLRTVLVTNAGLADRVPTHTIFALALSTWAMLLVWEHRPVAAAAVTGLICQVNLMNGLSMVVVFAIAIALDWRAFVAKRLLLAVGVWSALSAPAISWAVQTPAPDVDAARYVAALRAFFWYHLFPLDWGPRVWLRCGGLIAVLALCDARGAVPRRRIVAGTLLGIAFTWTVALIVSVVPALQPLVLLQWCRTGALLVLLLVPCAAYFAVDVVPRLERTSAFVWSGLLSAAWGLAHGALPALLLLGVCLVSVMRASGRLPAEGRPAGVGELGLRVATLAVCVLLLAGMARRIRAHGFDFRTQPVAWVDIQKWAREATSRDKVFLTPPRFTGFRVYSQRDVYFSEKNLDALMLTPQHTGEVLRKRAEIRALGLAETPLERVSWEEILRFCDERGIAYVILPTAVRVEAVPVYRNSEWSAYEIRVSRASPHRQG